MRNRRRQRNQLQGGPMVFVILSFTIVGCVALYFIHIQNRMLALGNVKKRLEVQLVDLVKQIEAAESRYAELTSRPALERSLNLIGSDLIPIPDHRIVSLEPHLPIHAQNVRTVSNRGLVAK